MWGKSHSTWGDSGRGAVAGRATHGCSKGPRPVCQPMPTSRAVPWGPGPPPDPAHLQGRPVGPRPSPGPCPPPGPSSGAQALPWPLPSPSPCPPPGPFRGAQVLPRTLPISRAVLWGPGSLPAPDPLPRVQVLPRTLPPASAYLQGSPAGPGAVLAKLLLAPCRAEFPKLLPLQLMGGETGQKFKEGAAGDTGDVQVLGHEAPHGAGLGQPRRAGDTCRGWDAVGGGDAGTGRQGAWGSAQREHRGLRGSPGSRGCSVKCCSGSRPSAWQNCWTWLAVFSGWISTRSPAAKLCGRDSQGLGRGPPAGGGRWGLREAAEEGGEGQGG